MNNIQKLFDNSFQSFFPLEYEISELCQRAITPREWRIEDKKKLEKAISSPRFYELLKENQILTQVTSVLEIDDFDNNIFAQGLIKKSLYAKASVFVQMKEYLKILQILHTNQIQYALLKALPYLYSLQNEFHKQAHDIDILVPISEFHRAARLLQKNGYVHLSHRQGSKIRGLLNSSDFYLPKQEEFFYKHPFAIELHTSIVQTHAFSSVVLTEVAVRGLTKEFFERKVKKIIGNNTVSCLSESDVVVNLVIHAFFNHVYQSVMLFHEIALLITNKKINSRVWVACEVQFEQMGILSYYYWYFCLFDWIYPSLLPKRMIAKLTIYKNNWNLLQKITFFALKFYVFHPKSHALSDKWKKVVWAIIDGRVLDSITRKIAI